MEFCDEAAELPACRCIAGYDGRPCTWAGVVSDPEFEDAEAWITSGGASVLPFGRGLNPGLASFPASVVCNAGEVSQVVDLPRYEDAGVLVAEVTYRAWGGLGVGVGLGDAFHPLSSTGPEQWQTTRLCLGEAGSSRSEDAAGGPVPLRLSAWERPSTCPGDTLGFIEVDRVWLDVAQAEDECPDVGTVLNGEAEPGMGGWLFDVEPSDDAIVAEASLVAEVGRDQTGGARLYKEAGGGRTASMAVALSVPLASTLPSPALRFWWKASERTSFSAHIGTFSPNMAPLGTLVGTGEWRQVSYCLPPWTHGVSLSLGFRPATLSTDPATELVVDDVELVSDSRCGAREDIFDPGFDSAPNQWPGVYDFGSEISGESIAIVEDASLARTGRGVLEMTYTANDQILRFETRVLVPEGDGPQLLFYSKVPTNAPMTVNSFLGRSATPSDVLLPSASWELNDLCLPAEWAGRWFPVQIRIGPSFEPFELFNPAMRVYLDDFELTTSEGCQ